MTLEPCCRMTTTPSCVSRALLVDAAADLVVLALAMFGERLHLMDMATQSWVELVLSLPIVLWAGWPFFSAAGSPWSTAAPTCGR
jgi:cation transport ATPase